MTSSLIATSNQAFNGKYGISRSNLPLREYTDEQIHQIINSGDIDSQIELSRNYFYKDGFYREILTYYATLLKYTGILIPHPSFGKNLSNSVVKKKYFQSMVYLDKMNIPTLFTNISLKVLISGSYYGIILQANKDTFTIMDLPTSYCISRFKDVYGNDVIEFNLAYFNTIIDEEVKKRVLKTYPKDIQIAYKKYKRREIDQWYKISTNISICFQMFDGRPPFLNIIPATINYDIAVENEKAREAEEIKKIIVQHIDHLSDGTLLFEPEEVEVMHRGAVGMMKGNPNVSVLTSYGDVSAITSKTSLDTVSSNLEKMMKTIFAEGGVSSEMFSSTSNLTIGYSINTQISLMMILARKYATFLTNIINSIYSNKNVDFSYSFLPVAEHNMKDYIDETMKLAASGGSYLLPNLALGFSQREIVDLKDLENKMLKLTEKFIPLQASYQQSPSVAQTSKEDKGGGQEKDPTELSPITERNRKKESEN